MISKLNWYLNRLKIMSIREIISMRFYRFIRDRVRPFPSAPDDISLEIQPLTSEYLEFYTLNFPNLKKDIQIEADKICENRITFFSKEVDFGVQIDWNRDWITGKKWPRKKVNYRTSQIGDPKDIWELNRHQFLLLLGKAFFLSGDEKYSQKALDIMESWVDQNPPLRGINWASSIEFSMRQLSWLWTLKFLKNSKYLNERVLKKIKTSMFLQTYFITKHLSFYSSAGNHLISELACMIIVGICLGQTGWVKKALSVLTEQIDNQIHSDGVGAEQSSSYQVHTMEFYTLALLAAKEIGITFPEKIIRGLHRGAIFLNSISNGNGDLISIGDNDSGEILKLSQKYKNYKTLISLISFITDDYNLLQDDIYLDEKSFWLLGPKKYYSLVKRAKNGSSKLRDSFPVGGYYILRKVLNNKRIKIIFDCGPIGMKPMAGHGHADALSFILFVNDFPVFIDPGTYTYFKNDFWRNYFRGTTAHNTLTINKKNQVIFRGRFLVAKQGICECLEWIPSQKVSGQFKGYSKRRKKTVHLRTIKFDTMDGVVSIHDSVEVKDQASIEQYFHLGKKCDLIPHQNNVFKIKTPRDEFYLELDKNIKTEVYNGDEILPLGWYSEMYNSKQKTITLMGKKQKYKSENIVTRIIF